MTHRDAVRNVRHAEREIKRLELLYGAYDLGGGRRCGDQFCNFKNGLYEGKYVGDCSWLQGLTCEMLGIKLSTPPSLTWTGSLYKEGKAGKGKLYTLFVKDPEDTEGHSIGCFHHHLKDRWFECGGSDNPHPNNGVTFWKPTAERIAEFPYRRHFEGY